jgi:hypothetical protein
MMRSSKVAEQLRRMQIEDDLALSIDERVQLALELGERDLQAYMAATGLDRDAANRELDRGTQRSRRPSRCIEQSLQ